MTPQNAREIQAALMQPFAPEDLEWRLQTTFEDSMRGSAVPYVTNRAIQNRLDDVVGPDNWYNEYKPWHGSGKKEAQICGISIYFEGRGFITKWDGAEDSDIEPVKGGLSDSMKRAAVQWGIGRVLYNMDTVYVDIEKKGRSYIIKKNERATLDKAYLAMLKNLGLSPASAGGVQSILVPRNVSEPAVKETGTAGEKPKAAADKRTPAIPNQPPKAPQQSAASQQAPASQVGSVTTQEQQAEFEYRICAAKVQKSMNGSNTLVVLETPAQKRVNAFIRGAHPELIPGMLLTETRLEVKTQDTVVFNILEDFQVISTRREAA